LADLFIGTNGIVVDQRGRVLLIRRDDVLWVKRTDYDVWNLPGGKSEDDKSPWETALRETREETGLDVPLLGLSGVYIKPVENQMIFCFTAKVTDGRLTVGPEADDFAYCAAGEEPGNSLPKQVIRAADATRHSGKTFFRV
jgi:8-oxo-dGTP pyrophosphatase MutT (NUDIX family)